MKRSAFTLVELLIVMAVIAALISVVAPMGLNALKQARTVQVATDLRAAMNTV
ncbi:MAG TPA: prepilin-type N-terminal cleavage/methylation domain-containing protein, partial [Thermotogota bacterium]|nr:prepilin-type N-terminal cleavage/methylation domain-containing protein [Thermotogota bacterium]